MRSAERGQAVLETGRMFSAILVLFAALGAPLSGQGREPLNLIPRIGVTLSPEQFTFGVEAPFSNIADITYLVFAPSIDIGLGDQRTTVRANANLGYAVPTGTPDTRVFPLLGIAVFHESFETNSSGEEIGDGSNTGFGVNLGAGAQVSDLVVEALIGIGDLPSLAVLVGYSLFF
jgi:hypothetical protein